MPEMHFTVRWPDGSEQVCYSPSLVVREHLETDVPYDVADFVQRVRTALDIASERVRAKYGFACTSAMETIADVERLARSFPSGTSRVTVTGFAD